ncbi:hypothetical protein [Jeotgalibacillus campisalis]|uniref:Stage VI sporulation protein D N-terminal domain-containing protein n=1 Tax=Jeotgalibacillus campisalis TaxID=220754 RepID=A0A0C2VBA9_9BACL|nr:hypothetical protein [Jeotgalibacillus campisalis]KIL46227.1 hypothetical protein KR50_29020 [Jeotgalibacillus campisalis]
MKKNHMPLSLNESIVLDGEIGLKEIRSLSFEPSVSITEHADHILIEGSLYLAGEGIASMDSRYDERAYSGYDRIQVINHPQDEQLEFEHYFPITVAVSSSRVSNIHQLDVYIEHIDYELKDERLLSIHADIVVDGVSENETIQPAPEEHEEESNKVNEPVDEEREEVHEEVEEVHELPIRLLPNPLNEWNGQVPQDQQVEFDLDDQSSSTEEKKKELEEIEPFIASQSAVVPEIEIRATPAAESLYAPYNEDYTSADYYNGVEDEAHAEVSGDDPSDTNDTRDEEDSQQRNDDQALMSFVSSLEEEMTTIKICIAQQDETPEMVAERYGVSMVHLMKSNHFESRAPFEKGKLIFIP